MAVFETALAKVARASRVLPEKKPEQGLERAMARSRRARQTIVFLTTRPHELEHFGNVQTTFEGHTLSPREAIPAIREKGQMFAFVPAGDDAMLEECARALEFEIVGPTDDPRPNTIWRITPEEVTRMVGDGDVIVAPLMNTSGQIAGFRISTIGL